MTVFTATLDAVNTNKSKTVIKLSLSNTQAAIFAQKYLGSVDKEIRVSFDDPQMEMSMRPAPNGRGLVATVGGDGVVENVSPNLEEDDNQADLFEQIDPEQEESEPQEENEGPGDSEVDFEDGEASDEPGVEHEEDAEGDPIDPEAIEEFILNKQPTFDSIPYNFAELLRRRREEDVTWMELAKEAGIPSTKLQSSYQAFKKLVVAQMREQGVA